MYLIPETLILEVPWLPLFFMGLCNGLVRGTWYLELLPACELRLADEPSHLVPNAWYTAPASRRLVQLLYGLQASSQQQQPNGQSAEFVAGAEDLREAAAEL